MLNLTPLRAAIACACLLASIDGADATCATPPTAVKAIWHVNRASGSDTTGNGSAAAPWASVNAIFSGSKGAPPKLGTVPYWHPVGTAWVWTTPNQDAGGVAAGTIQPGDEVLFASGDYGDVAAGVYNEPTVNSDWVTLAPEPGATPIFDLLAISYINKLRVTGIQISSIPAAGDTHNLVNFGTGVTDAIVTGNVIETAPDDVFLPLAKATQAWWYTSARTGIYFTATDSCITATGNTIRNVVAGGRVAGANEVFDGNTIDGFSADAIDYFGPGPSSVSRNRMLNANAAVPYSTLHQDALQVQDPAVVNSLTANFNIVLRDAGTGRVLYPGLLQGLDNFGNPGIVGLTLIGNQVTTSACQGINFSGINGGLIEGNTVIDDGSGYGTGSPRDCTAWLAYGAGSVNVIGQYNNATSFVLDLTGTGVTSVGNACLVNPLGGSCLNAVTTAAGVTYSSKPGTVGGITIPTD